MRNQLPCTVQALQAQGRIVLVRLQLADGSTLASRITMESAELLALRAGQPVVALCKATAVVVGRAGEAGRWRSGTLRFNLLPGKATRVSRGESGDEVAAAIDAGLQLVGFAPPGSRLRAGSRVLLEVDDAAVVIALAD